MDLDENPAWAEIHWCESPNESLVQEIDQVKII